MDFNGIIKELKSGKYRPAYLLAGDEPYFIDQIADYAQTRIIPTAEQDFNLMVVYGKDTNARAVVESCRQFPFMGERKLVLVREAQDIRDWEVLDAYLKNPVPTTVLILAFKNKKPDGRSAWVKTMKDKHVFYESKSLYDSQIPGFISDLAKENGISMDPDATALMAEYIGNDLGHLHNEIDKIKLNYESGRITRDIISDMIGVSKEFNVFELCKSFSRKDGRRAYQIALNLAVHIKSNPLVPTISSIYNHFNKIWGIRQYASKSDSELMSLMKIPFPAFVKEYREAAGLYTIAELERIFGVLKTYDLKSKGVDSGNTSQENLLLEMVLAITRMTAVEMKR